MDTNALVIGIDVGGTEIKAGVMRGAQIIHTERFATQRENGAEHSISQVLLAAKTMHEKFPEAVAIGVVVPGVVDAANGIAIYSENIHFDHVPFRKLVHDLTGKPVSFGHDVRAGGVAETLYGAGRGYKNSFFMPIGTGIAGAIIIEDVLFDNPFGGEIGHFDVNSGFACACGLIGCLESIATGPSIAREYNLRSGKNVAGAFEVLQANLAGDGVATEVWDAAIIAIAKVLTATVNLLSPDIMILGGGISKAGAHLIDPVIEYLDRHLTFQPRPQIVSAALGDSSGMIGAGIFGLRALHD
ncbi:MAG: ROK family protein [Actinomycetes bacterium]